MKVEHKKHQKGGSEILKKISLFFSICRWNTAISNLLRRIDAETSERTERTRNWLLATHVITGRQANAATLWTLFITVTWMTVRAVASTRILVE